MTAPLFLVLAGGTAMAQEADQEMQLGQIEGGVRLQHGQPGCTVSVAAGDESLGSGRIAADGRFFISVQVPDGARVSVKVNEADACDTAEASTEISASQTVTVASEAALLPKSEGPNVGLGLLAAVGALGVGGSLIVTSRRNSKKA